MDFRGHISGSLGPEEGLSGSLKEYKLSMESRFKIKCNFELLLRVFHPHFSHPLSVWITEI